MHIPFGDQAGVISYYATVKEQRVNGYRYLQDLFGWVIYLRCILISLEISYG